MKRVLMVILFLLLGGISAFGANSFEETKKKAEQGDVKAQVGLAKMYSAMTLAEISEQGLSEDYVIGQILFWFGRAAEQGDREAQKELTSLPYLSAETISGWNFLKKIAEQGDLKAQVYLAHRYEDGLLGTPQNSVEAVKWYRLAAEQGDREAQSSLGLMYDFGRGVPQDYVRAYAWYNLAAAGGSDEARKNRKSLLSIMTPQQIADAQTLSAQFQERINGNSNKDPADQGGKSTAKEHEIKGTGTGFIITRSGYIVTCNHVIDGADSIEVWAEGGKHTASIVRIDKSNDLAVLKISGEFQALPFSSDKSAQLGQSVFTIGYPNPVLQGVSEKYTEGSISSLSGFQDDIRLYQVSVPVQPGNSGGPLLDKNGNVVGIIVSMLNAKSAFSISGSLPQNVNYAVKSVYAQALIQSIPEASNKLLPENKNASHDSLVERAGRGVGIVVTY